MRRDEQGRSMSVLDNLPNAPAPKQRWAGSVSELASRRRGEGYQTTSLPSGGTALERDRARVVDSQGGPR